MLYENVHNVDKLTECTETGPTESTSQHTTSPTSIKIYKRRWYILSLFAAECTILCLVWNTWTPIARPSEIVFKWTDAQIASFNNYGCITPLLVTLFIIWIMTKYGIRTAMVLNSAFIVIATGIRCIPVQSENFMYLALAGSLINGLAIVFPAGTVAISAVWFPPNERTTATAISSAASYLGMACSFLFGTYIVPDYFPLHTEENQTSIQFNTTDITRTHANIQTLMYIHFSLAISAFILVVIYFPSKPKLPPCISASIPRISFSKGLLNCVKNSSFWIIFLPYMIVLGSYSCWTSLINIMLKIINVSQSAADWLGVWCIIATCVGSIIFGKISDMLQRRMKTLLLLTHVISACFFLWFALLVQEILKLDLVQLYISAIIASFTMGGTIPIYYEICCETTYPTTSELIIGGVEQLGVNITSVAFYLLFFVPGIGDKWIAWAMLAAILMSLPFLCLYKATYGRLNTDDQNVNRDIQE